MIFATLPWCIPSLLSYYFTATPQTSFSGFILQHSSALQLQPCVWCSALLPAPRLRSSPSSQAFWSSGSLRCEGGLLAQALTSETFTFFQNTEAIKFCSLWSMMLLLPGRF